MKTPREILLQRHRAAEPRLDALRQALMADLSKSQAQTESRPSNWLARAGEALWRELFLPCKPVWTAVAVVWAAILVVNVSLREATPSHVRQLTDQEVLMNYYASQRLMSELLAERPPLPAKDSARPKPDPSRQRSELNSSVFPAQTASLPSRRLPAGLPALCLWCPNKVRFDRPPSFQA